LSHLHQPLPSSRLPHPESGRSSHREGRGNRRTVHAALALAYGIPAFPEVSPARLRAPWEEPMRRRTVRPFVLAPAFGGTDAPCALHGTVPSAPGANGYAEQTCRIGRDPQGTDATASAGPAGHRGDRLAERIRRPAVETVSPVPALGRKDVPRNRHAAAAARAAPPSRPTRQHACAVRRQHGLARQFLAEQIRRGTGTPCSNAPSASGPAPACGEQMRRAYSASGHFHPLRTEQIRCGTGAPHPPAPCGYHRGRPDGGTDTPRSHRDGLAGPALGGTDAPRNRYAAPATPTRATQPAEGVYRGTDMPRVDPAGGIIDNASGPRAGGNIKSDARRVV
jgi:hypothetical protein